jgi:hypothetical protein
MDSCVADEGVCPTVMPLAARERNSTLAAELAVAFDVTGTPSSPAASPLSRTSKTRRLIKVNRSLAG